MNPKDRANLEQDWRRVAADIRQQIDGTGEDSPLHRSQRGRCTTCHKRWPCPHERSRRGYVQAPIVDGNYLPPRYLLGVAPEQGRARRVWQWFASAWREAWEWVRR